MKYYYNTEAGTAYLATPEHAAAANLTICDHYVITNASGWVLMDCDTMDQVRDFIARNPKAARIIDNTLDHEPSESTPALDGWTR